MPICIRYWKETDEMETQEKGKMVKLYTGSYNAPVLTGDGSTYRGNGEGICLWSFDEETGGLEKKESYGQALNASWLAFSPDSRLLYAVNELDDYQGTHGGALSAYKIGEDGRLVMINIRPVMGAAPCHVSCDEQRSFVYTANYNGGSLSCFRLAEDGSLLEMDWQLVHQFGEKENRDGREGLRNPVRQEKPHVHSAALKGDTLWIADLGTDEVACMAPGRCGGKMEHAASVFLPAGCGPRSIAFSGDGSHVYVTCELSNEIAVLRWEKEEKKISLQQMISSLPEDEGRNGEKTRNSTVGGVVLSPDGRYLYVGNRGDDSIGVYHVDNQGSLSGVQWISSDGKNPRGFQISPSGRWLLAANQDSDNLVVYERDGESGKLERRWIYEAGAVVCLQFLK